MKYKIKTKPLHPRKKGKKLIKKKRTIKNVEVLKVEDIPLDAIMVHDELKTLTISLPKGVLDFYNKLAKQKGTTSKKLIEKLLDIYAIVHNIG